MAMVIIALIDDAVVVRHRLRGARRATGGVAIAGSVVDRRGVVPGEI
jgi:hypothetical protein